MLRWTIPKHLVKVNSTQFNWQPSRTTGAIGVSVSGVPFGGPMTAPNQDLTAASVALNKEIDCTCGTVDAYGNYMYRKAPLPLLGSNRRSKHDGLLGWMADGFPLYGPLGDDGIFPTDLDPCGGHAGDSANNGEYHYHALPGAGSCSEAASNAPNALRLPRCFAGCVPDDSTNAVALQAMGYNDCIRQPFMVSAGLAAATLPTQAAASFSNCSAEFAAMEPAGALGLADVNNGLLVVLAGISLFVLILVMCVMFREDLDLCCAPGQSVVHRKDPPRQCRSRLCCHATIAAGGNCDLCITRCGLGCCAPRTSTMTEEDFLPPSKGLGSNADALAKQAGLSTTLSFRRKMQMTLTQMDIEAQHTSEAAYMDEIDQHVSDIEDTGSLFFRSSRSLQLNSSPKKAQVVPLSGSNVSLGSKLPQLTGRPFQHTASDSKGSPS